MKRKTKHRRAEFWKK